MAGSIFTQQLLSDGTDPECITVLKAGLWMQLIGFIIYTIIGLRFCFVSRRWATQQGARYTLPTGANLVQLSWVNQAVTIVITVQSIVSLNSYLSLTSDTAAHHISFGRGHAVWAKGSRGGCAL